ncbi:MAG: tRNA (guanosine(37)-N1)-methyltransferase TrmD, partial [Acidimicrobiaceae bacterium]
MSTNSVFRIDVFSIFPKLVDDFCNESLLGRAREESIVGLRCHDLRDYGDESRRVDDALYGGGA